MDPNKENTPQERGLPEEAEPRDDEAAAPQPEAPVLPPEVAVVIPDVVPQQPPPPAPPTYVSAVFHFDFDLEQLMRDAPAGGDAVFLAHARRLVNNPGPSHASGFIPLGQPAVNGNNVPEPEIRQRFQCSSCNYTADTMGNVHKHQRIHDNGTFQCRYPGCTAMFRIPGTRTKHEKDQHKFHHGNN